MIAATSASDLEAQFHLLGPEKLSREPGVRTRFTVERWIIRKYLEIRANSRDLQFPLKLDSRDKPDFQLVEGENSRGIEVTKATFEGLEIARKVANELEIDVYSTDSVARSAPIIPIRADAIRDHLLGHLGPSAMYYGDEPECELQDLLARAINKKLKRLNHPDFEKFSTNELLIYADAGLPDIKWKRLALSELRRINTNHQGLQFDKIVVLSGNELQAIV